jgi:predicted TIM-barrel fold metal-dependent hydrolase
MRVTDAQVHAWEIYRANRPPHTFPVATLEKAMSDANVDRVVIIPTTFEGYPVDAGNEYALKATWSQPHHFAMMALVDPTRPDEPDRLADLARRPGMKGFRLVRWRGNLDDLKPLWRMAARLDLPVALAASHGAFDMLPPIVEQNPDITFLMDHMALPAEGPDPFAEFDRVLAAAKYKNLIVKASSISRWSKEPYPFEDTHKYIRRLYEAYGPQRLAWGSDYSWIADRQTYRESVGLIREACDFISAVDKEWILDKTLSRVLKWED